MRCYVIAAGIIFGIIFILHIARIFAEGTWLVREPTFILASVLSLGMAVWALVLITKPPR